MKKIVKKIGPFLFTAVGFWLLDFIDYKYLNALAIPPVEKMSERHIDFITIDTVFAGFAFTTLGILLGLASETLIKKVKQTGIMKRKLCRLINCLIYFTVSVTISLLYILFLDDNTVEVGKFFNLNSSMYILSLGFLSIGFLHFIFSIYELYDLITRVYSFNMNVQKDNREKIEEELKNQKEVLNKDLGDEEE